MAEVTRMDMHVHSKYSTNPSQWVLKKLGCSESYTEPGFIYKRLKEKGMDLVTITDHDHIQACLDIAHLPDTCISQEATAVFPEDGCKIHILTYNITEKHFAEIQQLKSDIYDLAGYLHASRIPHAVAHPFFSVNGKLDYQHFEKLLLLFKTFECNGAREESLNSGLRFILNHLCPNDFEYLENKYGFKALGPRPWEKSLTGGSDDHSSLNIGRMFTEVPGKCTIQEFLDKIEKGHSEARGTASTPKTMAHNLYAIGYQYCKTRFKLSKYTRRDSFLGFMDMALNPGQQNSRKTLVDKIMSFLNTMKNSRPAYGGKGIHQVLTLETEKLIRTDPEIKKIVNAPLNRHEPMGA